MNFIYLPGFAQFISDQHLEEFVRIQIGLSRELKLPMLKYFEGMPEEQLFEFSRVAAVEFLRYFSTNRVDDQIADAMKEWVSNQLPVVSREEIAAEDITIVHYIRKQAFLKLLPEYTTEPREMLGVIGELDEYMLRSETLLTNTYITLLNEKLTEQLHFNEKIANTSPGVIYIFDLLERKEVYSNQKVQQMLGYTHEELQAMGDSYLEQVQHPEDIPRVLAHFEAFGSASDGEVRTFEHRLLDKKGRYRWMRNYESVFRRTENGAPVQLIGIALDIDQERENAQALKRREAQLLEAQELAKLGSFEWNLAADEADVSPQLLKIFDLDHAGQFNTFMARVHPADRARVMTTVEEATRDNGLYDCEYRFLGEHEEKVIWSRGTVSIIDGNPIMKGTVMDVTSRHELVRRLQQSDALYKQSQALTHIGNWLWEIEANHITWSDEMYRIYGLVPQSEEVSFSRLLELIHPDDREVLTSQVSRSLETYQPNDFHHRIILPDGTERVLHAKGEVVLDESGKPQQMVGTGQDVTEQYRIEAELRQKQNFIQKITDAAPSIITSYNVNTGVYTFVSQGLEKRLGYNPEEAYQGGIGFFVELVHPDDLGKIMEENAKALEAANQPGVSDTNQIVAEFQYRMRHKNGEYRWFHTYGTIFDRNQQGMVEQVLNISVDVTERVEAEQEIEEKTVLLEQSNASLKEFAYVASHDLKEPLRKISMFSDRLLHSQRDRLTPDGQVYLTKIVDASTRMQDLINDILAISTVTGDKTFSAYDLQMIMDEVVQALEHKVESKNATVETDGLPVAHIIPSQFRQLFLNLINNALKFSKPGTSPVIRVSHHFAKPAEVKQLGLGAAKRYLVVQVTDNGIGFDNKFSNKIFAIFQRLHNKNEFEGTGIGLAICKRIVENHGGIIWAESVPDQGATFTIVIPQ